MSRNQSAALPIAFVTLRILIVLNWVFAAFVLALLVFSVVNEPFAIRALGASGFAGPRWVIMAMRGIMVLGLAAIVVNYGVLKRLVPARAAVPEHRDRTDRQRDRQPWKPVPRGRRLFGRRLAVGDSHLRPRARLRRRDADARRPRGDGLMAIVVKLDELLHDRRMTLTELADRIDITLANLSILKTGKARAIRFSTLEAICEVLTCQPGDLLEFQPDSGASERSRAA
jgi:putative transcriptional regulator